MRKNIVHVKLQPRMQAFGHVEMANGDQYQLWVGQELENRFSDAAIRPLEMHVLYNPDGVVKYSVIQSSALQEEIPVNMLIT